MLTGWGIFVIIFAFSIGAIAGAGGLAAFALSAAIKGKARTENLDEKIEVQRKKIMSRVDAINAASAAIASVEKTAPRPIPELRPLLCIDCGKKWKGLPNVRPFCPACASADCVDTSMIGDHPFVGMTP
jgi:hypothetical protein